MGTLYSNRAATHGAPELAAVALHAEVGTHRIHEHLEFRGVDHLVAVEVVLLEHQGRLDGSLGRHSATTRPALRYNTPTIQPLVQ